VGLADPDGSTDAGGHCSLYRRIDNIHRPRGKELTNKNRPSIRSAHADGRRGRQTAWHDGCERAGDIAGRRGRPDGVEVDHVKISGTDGGLRGVRYRTLNSRVMRRFLGPIVGHYTTTNVWPAGKGTLLATVGRCLFRSSDGGQSWRHVHTLPAASGPMGVLPTSFCEAAGRLYLAEYTLDDRPARILGSDDEDETWTVRVRSDEHRHFHGVFRDPYSDRVWVTAGDSDAESAIGVLEDGTFRSVGRGSQRWRAVGLAFTAEAVLWGVDSSFSPTVEILRLPRTDIGAEIPEPVTVGTTDSSVFYAESLSVDGEE